MPTAAIVVAAGSSRRTGFDKLFAKLGPLPVLAHSLRTFQHLACIDEIVVVTAAENESLIKQWIAHDGLTKLSRIVPGGRLRQQSVLLGLRSVAPGTEVVAIHDGARPLIAGSDVVLCWSLAKEHGAAACARRITDTVKRANGNLRVTASVDRTNLWAMETPQIFDYELLMEAYEHISRHGLPATDEVSAVQSLGKPVVLSETLKPNLKITFPHDLAHAEHLLPFSKSHETLAPKRW